MRKILPTNETVAGATKGPALGGYRHDLPSTGIYAPRYKGVQYVYQSSGGNGQISFMAALAQEGRDKVQKQQKIYDGIEIAQTIADVDSQHRDKMIEWWNAAENISGRGFMEYATKTYDDLCANALKSASGSVAPQLEYLFKTRKNDIAHSAFQQEHQAYTAYAISETENQLSLTLNELMLSPEQNESLYKRYEQQISTLQNILSAQEFAKFYKAKMNNFIYSYGLGLIKTSPYQAVDLVKGDQFKVLPQQQFSNLQSYAQKEVEHQEDLKERRLKMMESENQKAINAQCEEDELKALYGELSESDVLANQDYSTTQKMKLIRAIRSNNKKIKEEININDQLSTAIAENSQAPDIQSSQKETYVESQFKQQNLIRGSEGKTPLSLTEETFYLQNHQRTLNCPMKNHKNRIYYNLMHETDPMKVLDAAMALQDTEYLPAHQGISKEIRSVAAVLREVAGGNKDASQVVAIRDLIKNQKIQDKELNLTRWNQFKADNDGQAGIINIIQDNISKYINGPALRPNNSWQVWKPRLQDMPDGQLIINHAYDMFERIFKLTGSEDYAQNAVISFIKNNIVLKNRKYNANFLKKDYMEINPPRHANTGFTDDELKKIIPAIKRKAIAEAGIKVNPKDVHFESVSLDSPTYTLYHLVNPDNLTSRDYLTNKDGNVIIFDFNDIKNEEQ